MNHMICHPSGFGSAWDTEGRSRDWRDREKSGREKTIKLSYFISVCAQSHYYFSLQHKRSCILGRILFRHGCVCVNAYMDIEDRRSSCPRRSGRKGRFTVGWKLTGVNPLCAESSRAARKQRLEKGATPSIPAPRPALISHRGGR